MIHHLTMGVFSPEAFRDDCVMRILQPIPRAIVDQLIVKHAVAPDEFTVESSPTTPGYNLITIRWLPPTSGNAVRFAKELCDTIPGCIAVDAAHRALIPTDEI